MENDPFDWPSKANVASVTQYGKGAHEVSWSSSWHDVGNDCDYTTVTWPDGSTHTMSMDPRGTRSAGFQAANGRYSAVPVDLIDKMSLTGELGKVVGDVVCPY